ncbi:hypothetical protein MASR2M79_10720 [Aminivibrio sp.]
MEARVVLAIIAKVLLERVRAGKARLNNNPGKPDFIPAAGKIPSLSKKQYKHKTQPENW